MTQCNGRYSQSVHQNHKYFAPLLLAFIFTLPAHINANNILLFVLSLTSLIPLPVHLLQSRIIATFCPFLTIVCHVYRRIVHPYRVKLYKCVLILKIAEVTARALLLHPQPALRHTDDCQYTQLSSLILFFPTILTVI